MKGASMKPALCKALFVTAAVLFLLAVIVGHVSEVGAHDLSYLGLACVGAGLAL
jgi:hypothetical protein